MPNYVLSIGLRSYKYKVAKYPAVATREPILCIYFHMRLKSPPVINRLYMRMRLFSQDC